VYVRLIFPIPMGNIALRAIYRDFGILQLLNAKIVQIISILIQLSSNVMIVLYQLHYGMATNVSNVRKAQIITKIRKNVKIVHLDSYIINNIKNVNAVHKILIFIITIALTVRLHIFGIR
jgi:hypothetical protein